ncbi:MAG: type II toxin-antitoxin system VapC family toxin [Magnetococcales bacterium]|nr:type II toxin-antitoxin system VapC family toxin [Nitrospirota bacterium]
MIGEDNCLSKNAVTIIEDVKNELFLSVVSVQEMIVKVSRGKLKLPGDLQSIIDNELNTEKSIKSLDMLFKHCFVLLNLPYHHKDPSDRMLISQAIAEDMTLITSDENIHKYNVKVLW